MKPSSPRFGGSVYAVLAVGMLGGYIIADGALHGETRHRIAAVLIGLVLIGPLFLVLMAGARGRRLLKQLLFALLPATALVLLIEVALAIFGLRPIHAVRLADPVLGHVLAARKGEADAWGFRNPRVPARARVDGVGQRRKDAYPVLLAERTGWTVYNMGLGGYGPGQYAELLERSFALSPKAIVIGFYFGNDLLDAHWFACLERHHNLRDPDVNYGPYPLNHIMEKPAPNLAMAGIDFLLHSSYLIGTVGRELKTLMKSTGVYTAAYNRTSDEARLDRGPLATLFTPRYRYAGIDPESSRIQDGHRITAIMLERMRDSCRSRAISLVLLPIHSKEYCYQLLMERKPAIQIKGLEHFAAAEGLARQRVLATAKELGIRVIDPLENMITELAEGHPLWPSSSDGHLNRAGHLLLAKLLQRGLE